MIWREKHPLNWKDGIKVDEVKQGIKTREEPLGLGDIYPSNLVRDIFGITKVLLEQKNPLYNLAG